MGNQFDIEEIKNMVSNIGTTLIGTDSVINPYTMGTTQLDNNNEDIEKDIDGIHQRVNGIHRRVDDVQAHLSGLESNVNYLLSKILERLDVISKTPSVIAFLALDKIKDYIVMYDDAGVVNSMGLLDAIDRIKEVLSGEKK